MSMDFLRRWFERPVRPRVVVLGNQKGGSGKSTTAMHLSVGLMQCGYSVGSVDLDGAQATFSHFIENRQRFAATSGMELAIPEHRRVEASAEKSLASAEAEDSATAATAFEALIDRDYIVVDTPGSDTFLSRLGHVLGDTLITPLNDSFLDLDVLVRIEPDGQTVAGPSSYAIAVLDRWGLRLMAGGRPLDWIVTRNRLAHLYSRNHRDLAALLQKLAPSLGYRLASGFGERVIFREQFLQGLTVLDQSEPSKWRFPSSSHAAARKEVWSLLEAIGLSEGGRQAAAPVAKAASAV